MAIEYAPAEEIDLPFGMSMPLPIAPVYLDYRHYKKGSNSHHRLFHGNDEKIKTPNLEIGELDERRVARWAGLQYGSRWLHGRYHKFYPDGAKLPETEHQNFALAVMFSAGYIPNQAVDVQYQTPAIINVHEDMRWRLQQPGVLHQQYDRHWAIGHFFGRYILRHGLREVIESETVARFIDPMTKPNARIRLGFKIISQAAEIVLDPVEPIYQVARETGQIRPENPQTARRFLMQHFDNRQPDYFQTIAVQAMAA